MDFPDLMSSFTLERVCGLFFLAGLLFGWIFFRILYLVEITGRFLREKFEMLKSNVGEK